VKLRPALQVHPLRCTAAVPALRDVEAAHAVRCVLAA